MQHTRQWDELVAEWRQLDEQEAEATSGINWRRGDLLLDVEPSGSGIKTGNRERLSRFAAEVGCTLDWLLHYRDTAAAWPAEHRQMSTSFSAHYELRRHPDRFALIRPGMTVNQARQAVGNSMNARRPVPQTDEDRVTRASELLASLPAEQRAAVVREQVEDPQVADEVVRDERAAAGITDARMRLHKQHVESARQQYELTEPRSHQLGAVADAEYAATKGRQAAEDYRQAIADLTANWPDEATRERVAALAQRAKVAWELAEAAARGEDLDAELQTLLEGGDA